MHHNDNVLAGLEKLVSLLPLHGRQKQLTRPLTAIHQAILFGFAETGVPPSIDFLRAITCDIELRSSLKHLADLDLIVLADDGVSVIGAYPFTREERPYRVTINGNDVYAMCALDAVSIAPMFGVRTKIMSACHVTGEPVTISMEADRILGATPADVRVGIRWQSTQGCAARNLCTEMIFLSGEEVALEWKLQDSDNISLYNLGEAIDFGDRFFSPLVSTRRQEHIN